MDSWLEREVLDPIWAAMEDLAGDAAEPEVEAKLREKLKLGETLSTSPLVKVVAREGDDNVTLLLRGRFKLFDGAVQPFVRVQLKVSFDLDYTLEDWPLKVLEWQTVVGDLQFEKKNVFKGEIGFGWDDGTWLGRGAFKVLPAKFGLDVHLGGLDDRGLMLGLGIDLPSPIPLGSTGVVLIGLGGDFAYNFVPRLNDGVAKASYDAMDYVKWSRDKELDTWTKGPPDKSAVGLRARAKVGDLASMGKLVQVEAGIAVITPGPVFVIGGEGTLIDQDEIKVSGFAAVDIASESLALGLALEAKAPKDAPHLIKANGSVDAFFSFRDTSLWYVRMGTKDAPAKMKVLEALSADGFLMIGNDALPPSTATGSAGDGVFFGVGVSYGGEWKWWILKFTARAGARFAAGIGWNPFQLTGAVAIYGELGIAVWEFEFGILLQADITGHLPDPTQLTAQAHYKLNLPWPIPDIEGTTEVSLGESAGVPDLKSPLLAGSNL